MVPRPDFPAREAPVRAVVVGLGNAAWLYDRRAPGTESVLSHAGALVANPRVELVGGCSPEAQEREAFAAHYGVPTYADIDAMLADARPDLASICSPTPRHHDHASKCLEAGVGMIWLEKPPTETDAQLRRLQARLASSGPRCTVLVNYMRRYSAPYRRLRDLLARGELGSDATLHVTYSRGLALNGSHLLDALFFLTGDSGFEGWGAFAPGPDAHHPSFVLRLPGGVTAHVTGVRLPYHCLDLLAVGSRGRAAVLAGGMQTRFEVAREHELFPGYQRLVETPSNPLGPPDIELAFAAALEDLLTRHTRGEVPTSNLDTAAQTQSLLGEVLDRAGD